MVTDFLLEIGANVNLADEWGYTPLTYASKNPKRLEELKKLLEKGGRPDLRDRNEDTPLHHGNRQKVQSIESLFVNLFAGWITRWPSLTYLVVMILINSRDELSTFSPSMP